MNALKKNWYLVVPAILILLPLVMTFYISTTYGYTMSQSWEVFKTSTQAETKFQRLKFTEGKFKSIQPGMSGREVFELLGVPLERHLNDTLWHYSVPLHGSETKYYHERSILLQPGTGKVTSVINRYHTPETGAAVATPALPK
jgi:hypothetical protein